MSGTATVNELLLRLDAEFTESADVGVTTGTYESSVAITSGPILLVIDGEGADARVQWVLPDVNRAATPTTRATFTLPPTDGTTRGVAGAIAKRVIKLLVPRVLEAAIGKGTGLLVRAWEDGHRIDNRLRWFTPATNHLEADHEDALAHTPASPGRMLVLIPDLIGSVRSSFGALVGQPAARLARVYSDRIIGFEHFTLSKSPRENAEDLARSLGNLGVTKVDVLAHGRGGVVARELIDREPDLVNRLVTAGTPHTGTALCNPDALVALLNRMSDLVNLAPLGGVDDVIATVLAIASVLAQAGAKGLPGLTAMSPDNTRLIELSNKKLPAGVHLVAAGSDFQGHEGRSFTESLGAVFSRAAFGPNDGLVRVDSAVAAKLNATAVQFAPTDHVGHNDYIARPELIDALIGDSESNERSGGGRDESTSPGKATRPARSAARRRGLGGDTGDLQITVAHCGLEYARFPIMIGNFEQSAMYTTQTIADERMGGRLTARMDAEIYPSRLGESCFVPNDDGSLYPPGVYVVGLGPSEHLDRDRLAHTVRQALLQRCMPLFDDATAPLHTEVGVASLLLGSAYASGLSIDDCVVGIIDGVVRANGALLRYRDRVKSDRTVRVGALQFVERAADRAEMAVRAIRDVPDVLGSSLMAATSQVRIESTGGQGGLPQAPSVRPTEQGDLQLEILARPPSVLDGSADDELTMDISMTGRNARVDRRTHSVNLSVVTGLAEQLPHAEPGSDAASTLFNLLIPEEFESRVSFSQPIQLVVDEHTANIAWELLSAPMAGNRRGALANVGGIVRRFSERESSRLVPRRAETNSALVISAGKMEGQTPLPGVFVEAEQVTRIMQDGVGAEVVQLSDHDAPIDPATFAQRLMAGHRFVHIASHGVFENDGKVSSALIGKGVRLNAGLVTKLRVVPDVVFLNCCQLAGIGTHRFAPGIARALMSIGVRAVIAAGWNVDDDAAVAFASTFWQSLANRDRLGQAVLEARRASSLGRGTTWAAYQCYGDAGYRLDNSRRPSMVSQTVPVSSNDLVYQIEALTVRAADIRQRDPARLAERVERLRDEFKMLRGTVENSDYATRPDVQRHLGEAARALGMHGAAAQAFRAVTQNLAGVRGQDLERLANVQARYAQRLARDPSITAELSDVALRDVEHEALFVDALATIERALQLGATGERHNLMGSLFKKWATVATDADIRDEHIKHSHDAYTNGATHHDGPYGQQNSLQMRTLLRDPDKADERADSIKISAPKTSTPQWQFVDQRPETVGYWDLADRGDRILTRLMAPEPEGAADISAAVTAYQTAFANRSSVAERDTVFTHLRDLQSLLPHDDDRVQRLDQLLSALSSWDPWPAPTPVTVRATTIDEPDDVVPTERAMTDLVIKMFPAGPGDAIVVEWGPPSERTRMLIDGGLKIEPRSGVGSYLAELGSTPFVDVFVVTHVDADHVKGAIGAIADHKLRYGDVWFNGTAQLFSTRSITQGRRFDELTLAGNRNQCVQGRAIVVSDNAPLPTVELPHGARVTFLSPNSDKLDALAKAWEKALAASATRSGDSLDDVSEFDIFESDLAAADDVEGDELSRGSTSSTAVRFGKDSSVPNGSSIAFLLEYDGKAMVFTGDAHADVLTESIERLIDERGGQRLRLDAFKVSHHGSVNNITPELLDMIKCSRFLVSTDGSLHDHPNTACLELIHAKHPKAKIYLNCRTDAVVDRAGEAVHVKYENHAIGI